MVLPKREPRSADNSKVRVSKHKGLTRMFLVLLFLYIVISFIMGIFKAYELKDEISVLKEEVEKLKKVNTELIQEVNYLNSKDAVEKLGREKLGMVRPGEIVVMPGKNNP